MRASLLRAGRIRRFLATGACVAATPAIAACGSEKDYANEPRPPAPINVTAAITEERVEASPDSFGAGPIVLIIANQSSEPQEITLETDEVASGKPGIKQTTSPVNPGGTAELKVDVSEGTYRLGVDSEDIRAATIEVSEERESAQNELLQP